MHGLGLLAGRFLCRTMGPLFCWKNSQMSESYGFFLFGRSVFSERDSWGYKHLTSCSMAESLTSLRRLGQILFSEQGPVSLAVDGGVNLMASCISMFPPKCKGPFLFVERSVLLIQFQCCSCFESCP